jgi:SAM-dependent methyltransferase
MERDLEYSFRLCHSGVEMIPHEGLPFDAPSALELTRARENFIRTFLTQVQAQAALHSALDVGCGVGYLSAFLADFGLNVTAIDGRDENILEARRRFPGIKFLTADAETLSLGELAPSDLVLCAGLLYHLENPFRVIRNLHALTEKVLIIEGMCTPGTGATMELLDEGTSKDQGLNFVAFYPTEACLVKMLYRSGFPFVYLFDRLPEHPLYRRSVTRNRERTMMAASKIPLAAPNLTLAKEPVRPVHGLSDPWTTPLVRSRYFIGDLRRSLFRALRGSSPRSESVR